MDLEKITSDVELTSETQNRYLTFFTDGQLFGLPIEEIVQITQMQEIVPMPEQSYYVKGIINLRGQIIPVIDMRLRFGKEEAEFTERTCIIIANVQGSDFGLIVDDVDEVVDINVDQISEAPGVSDEPSGTENYLTGIAKLHSAGGQKDRVVLLLRAGRLLKENELSSFMNL